MIKFIKNLYYVANNIEAIETRLEARRQDLFTVYGEIGKLRADFESYVANVKPIKSATVTPKKRGRPVGSKKK